MSFKNYKLYNKDVPVGNASLQLSIINIENEEDYRRLIDATDAYLSEIDKINDSITNKVERNKTEFDLLAESKKFRFIYNFSALFNKN